MNHELVFQCVRCGAGLAASAGRLGCTSCGATTLIDSGIPRFATNEDYFFGEIPREAMRELAAAVDRVGWDAAFGEMCDRQPVAMRDYIHQYIADASRANWKYLLQLPKDGVVLDLGCGWGETTLSLARTARRVVSMDLTWERLLLLQSRTRDLCLDRVTFAHGGDTLPLPFANETFDAVVLNGVLEWVPVNGTGDPRQCQLAILRELRRILKASGQVYIGIENRVGLKYFLGDIDEHSQMKYTSLLPRWLADRWCRWRSGKEYRTYTYSRRGYARLLQEAGFERTEFYCPYPDYREFDRVVPVTTGAVRRLFSPRSAWKRMILKTPGCMPLLRWTVPSFSIVASKSRSSESYLHRIVSEVSHRTGIQLTTPAGYESKPIGEVFALCAVGADSAPSILLRIAETPVAIKARIASAKHLESLWDGCQGGGDYMDVIPRNRGYGFLNEVAYTAEDIKPGISWRNIDAYRTDPSRALVSVADWLTRFQQATSPGYVWDESEMHAHADDFAARVQRLFPHWRERLKASQTDRAEPDDDNLSPASAVVCHGDLHLDNALFSVNDHRLTGIIDWDLGEMDGLPLTDLICLLLAYGIEIKRQTFCATVQSILEPHRLSEQERAVLLDYESTFALDETYRRYAVKVTVLKNIVRLSDRRPAAFQRLAADLSSLPTWIFSSSTRSSRLVPN